MKITRIEPTETIQNEQTFKAKLTQKTLSKAKRTLKKDTFELRKNLPENTDVKRNKYFGQPADNGGSYEASTADVIVAIGAIAAGLGLAFL